MNETKRYALYRSISHNPDSDLKISEIGKIEITYVGSHKRPEPIEVDSRSQPDKHG